MKPILCVDFDGVIHSYSSGWKGAEVIPDPPVPGALPWLLRAVQHFDVHIYSSRSKTDAGCNAMIAWFTIHSRNELGDALARDLSESIIFSHEKPAAFLTIDDRAICFEGNWAALDPKKLSQFKPWNKK